MPTAPPARRVRRTTVVGLVVALAGAFLVAGATAPPPAVALGVREPLTTVGHTPAGSVLTSTRSFTSAGHLDVVSAEGALLRRYPLPKDADPSPRDDDRTLTVCADVAVSTRAPATLDGVTHVLWYSLTSDDSGTAPVPEGRVLSAAPGGWVVGVGADDGTEHLVLVRTDGSRTELGSVEGSVVKSACDASALVVGTDRPGVATAVVRVPFDGTGPAVLRSEPYDGDVRTALRPYAVNGASSLVLTYGYDTATGRTIWPAVVDRYDGALRSPVVELPTGVGMDSAAVSPDSSFVCLRVSPVGCEAHHVPVDGPGTTRHLPIGQTSAGFVGDGFVLGCAPPVDVCDGLYRLTVPDLEVNRVYRTTTPLPVTRWSGRNRYAVAAEISRQATGSPDTVYLASGRSFADSLSVGPFTSTHAPVLLTEPSVVPAETLAELRRIRPARIVVLGGRASVSDEVVRAVRPLTGAVERVGGADRYEVAANLTASTHASWSTVYVASGEVFADGLVAAPAAKGDDAPLLLTRGDRLPPATADRLRAIRPSEVVVVGGTGTVSRDVLGRIRAIVGPTGSVRRVAGTDRYDLAARLAREMTTDGSGRSPFLASGETFPDALSLSSVSSGTRPILLTRASVLPAATAAALQRMEPVRLVVVGGEASVPPVVVQQVRDLPDLL
ncbi:cell wall-binding repeat-containing protein [Phycicoccus sp. BSK3Z-2]|uniref:Cell wall-binding repeat-containing protein n=1 Tax=Phycicoccus avicenniae TaxID=2828860 RepID=A0A941D9D3_9MICO|nr:cell wall-binding repeat-containing protein [Phycicoccus avicenniae]MBR7742892.1 cell wall-binding repeat-containing protein [Phycicoccus avicenniae]